MCHLFAHEPQSGALLAAQIAYRQPKSETRAAIIAYLKELN